METRIDNDQTPAPDALPGDPDSPVGLPPIATNVIRTTSPYAPADIHEGLTFEQRDPATLKARSEAERLIH